MPVNDRPKRLKDQFGFELGDIEIVGDETMGSFALLTSDSVGKRSCESMLAVPSIYESRCCRLIDVRLQRSGQTRWYTQ